MMLLSLAAAMLFAVQGTAALPFEHFAKEATAAAARRASAGAQPPNPRLGDEDRFLAAFEPLYYRMRLGAIELWSPRVTWKTLESSDAPLPASYAREHALTVLRLERAWIRRAEADAKVRARAEAAAAALEKWTRGWNDTKGPVETPEAQQAAADLSRILRDRDPSRAAPFARDAVLVLAPTRIDFFHVIAAAGAAAPALQSSYWNDGAVQWDSVSLRNRVKLLPLAWAPGSADGNKVTGPPMSPQASMMFIAHYGSHLLAEAIAPEIPAWLREGFALADAVELSGTDETLCTGRSEILQLAQGGRVPGTDAPVPLAYKNIEMSPYRGGPSAQFFIKELSKARERDGSFRIVNIKTGSVALRLHGPFLLGEKRRPPEVVNAPKPVADGYAEFFRAYSCAFAKFTEEQMIEKTPLAAAVVRALRDARAGAEPAEDEAAFAAAWERASRKKLGASIDAKTDGEGAFQAWLAAR